MPSRLPSTERSALLLSFVVGLAVAGILSPFGALALEDPPLSSAGSCRFTMQSASAHFAAWQARAEKIGAEPATGELVARLWAANLNATPGSRLPALQLQIEAFNQVLLTVAGASEGRPYVSALREAVLEALVGQTQSAATEDDRKLANGIVDQLLLPRVPGIVWIPTRTNRASRSLDDVRARNREQLLGVWRLSVATRDALIEDLATYFGRNWRLIALSSSVPTREPVLPWRVPTLSDGPGLKNFDARLTELNQLRDLQIRVWERVRQGLVDASSMQVLKLSAVEVLWNTDSELGRLWIDAIGAREPEAWQRVRAGRSDLADGYLVPVMTQFLVECLRNPLCAQTRHLNVDNDSVRPQVLASWGPTFRPYTLQARSYERRLGQALLAELPGLEGR